MLKEIYFRDPSDARYNIKGLEIGDRYEALLSKIRMILYTSRGDVLGEPDLGMNLEDYLFETVMDEGVIKNDFYAQVAKYIPEQAEYSIDCNITVQTDGVHNIAHLYITLNSSRVIGIEF